MNSKVIIGILIAIIFGLSLFICLTYKVADGNIEQVQIYEAELDDSHIKYLFNQTCSDYSFWINAELVKTTEYHNYYVGKDGFYVDGEIFSTTNLDYPTEPENHSETISGLNNTLIEAMEEIEELKENQKEEVNYELPEGVTLTRA